VAHPKDSEVYPIGTVVRLLKTGEFARIIDHTFLFEGRNFLHYLGEIEGREGRWCLIHGEVELEVLPSGTGKRELNSP
jgi:hypothetical protein